MNSELTKKFITHFEGSNFLSSPPYDETIKYFDQFCALTKCVKKITIGYSAQDREIVCYVVAKDGCFTPNIAVKKNKAIVLIQNGIHPGEIEGKDASMLLLRDILITKQKFYLLDNLVLLVIPIFNVDGHENASPFNRPNQNGPTQQGWRTTAHNLNLNRDYIKADSREMRAFLRFFSHWLPDFIIDNHATNGADYQYHVTYQFEKHCNIYAAQSKWMKEKFIPFVIQKVEEENFLTAPYIDLIQGNIREGINDSPSLPRYSTGYAALQNRPALLVETHSLKPFKNRVYSTLAMNFHSLEFINAHHKDLIKMNRIADERSIKKYLFGKSSLPVEFSSGKKFDVMNFNGFKSYEEFSSITDSMILKYSEEPEEFEMPIFNDIKISRKIKLPFAYYVPSEFKDINRILKLHGIKIKTLTEDKPATIHKYVFHNVEFSSFPYEGRFLVEFETELCAENILLRKNSFVVPCAQRTIRVIANLLEPDAPDSLAKWGFFNAFFERKEYAENYLFDSIAKNILNEDDSLRERFEMMIEADEEFRNSPELRMDFIYRNSPYFDKREKVYPIFRIEEKSIFDFLKLR